HVRKANARHEHAVQAIGAEMPDVETEAARHLVFRRGYDYIEGGVPRDAGILFISYQRNIAASFERIKRDQLNNADFPQPNTDKEALASPAPADGETQHRIA